MIVLYFVELFNLIHDLVNFEIIFLKIKSIFLISDFNFVFTIYRVILVLNLVH